MVSWSSTWSIWLSMPTNSLTFQMPNPPTYLLGSEIVIEWTLDLNLTSSNQRSVSNRG